MKHKILLIILSMAINFSHALTPLNPAKTLTCHDFNGVSFSCFKTTDKNHKNPIKIHLPHIFIPETNTPALIKINDILLKINFKFNLDSSVMVNNKTYINPTTYVGAACRDQYGNEPPIGSCMKLIDLSSELIKKGYALFCPSFYIKNRQDFDMFLNAENHARDKNIGIWRKNTNLSCQ